MRGSLPSLPYCCSPSQTRTTPYPRPLAGHIVPAPTGRLLSLTFCAPHPSPQLPAGLAASVVSIRAAKTSCGGDRKPSGRLVTVAPFLRDFACQASRLFLQVWGYLKGENPRQGPPHCLHHLQLDVGHCVTLCEAHRKVHTLTPYGGPQKCPQAHPPGRPCVTWMGPLPLMPTWRWTPPGPGPSAHLPASASSCLHRPLRLRTVSPPAASVPAVPWTEVAGPGLGRMRVMTGVSVGAEVSQGHGGHK